MVKSYSIEKMVLTFKLPPSSQTFYCLVKFYFAISSQIPRISNLESNIVYCLLFTVLPFILLRIITFHETVLHVPYI